VRSKRSSFALPSQFLLRAIVRQPLNGRDEVGKGDLPDHCCRVKITKLKDQPLVFDGGHSTHAIRNRTGFPLAPISLHEAP